MRRRLVGLACVAWVVAALTVGFGAAPARAAAPRDQGWWSATSVAVPGAPVAIPAAADVPARGLLVQGGGGAPTAYSALLYELDEGTTASTLTLAVAPNSLTTPAATLQVCGLLQPINHPEQGGPLTDAPPYDCGARKATATPTANTYKFDVSGLVTDKMVAVAILPTGPVDRVVLNAPDESSLTTQAGDAAGSGSAAIDTGGAAPSSDSIPTTGSDIVGSSAPVGGGFSSVDATPPVSVGDSPIAAPAPAVTPSGPASNLPFVPAATAAPEKATPIAVILLVAGVIGGALLWAFAGRPRARPVLP